MQPRNESIIRMFAIRKALRLGVGLLLGILAVPILSVAANHYVRAGASGNGSGSDWTDAYTDLPASLTRGDTYYMAAGTYSPHIFNDPTSGSLMITVKTATSSDHGTGTGWSDSYVGQVKFQATTWNGSRPGILDFRYSNYLIDGSYRSGWDSGYGMQVVLPPISSVNSGGQVYSLWLEGVNNVSNVTFKYVDVPGYGQWNTTFVHHYAFLAFSFVPNLDGTGFANITIDHCYVHDIGEWSSPLISSDLDGFTVQYTEIARNSSIPDFHSEGWSTRGATSNVVFRYNRFVDVGGTAQLTANNAGSTGTMSNWEIYGNVFWEKNPDYPNGVGNGVVSCINGNTCNNFYIYNNTAVNFTSGSLSGRWTYWVHSDPSSHNINVFDNLSYNSINMAPTESASGQVTMDYNLYINDTNVPSETHIQTGTSNIFNDSTNGDFHLTTETKDGLHLSPPYDVDPDGVKRGSDNNIWSRGAYQYAPDSSSPDPPSNLVVNVH